MHCGRNLPEAARFCSSCGRPTAGQEEASHSGNTVGVDSVLEAEAQRRLDEVARLARLVSVGPVTDGDVIKGASLYKSIAKLQLNPELPQRLLSDLRIYDSTVNLILAAELFWIDNPGARQYLRRDFDTYVDHGAITSVEANFGELEAIGADYVASLNDNRALAAYIDEAFLAIFMIGLTKHNLTPIKKRKIEFVADRIGLRAAVRAMERGMGKAPRPSASIRSPG